MGVHELGVELLLVHQGGGAVGGALPLAADPVEVDVVPDDLRQIDRHRLAGEGGQTDPSAPLHHVHGLVQGIGRPGALQDVVDTPAAGDPFHRFHGIFLADIDDMVRAELQPQVQPRVAGPGEDDGLGAQGLADGDPHQADRARAGDDEALPGDQAAQDVQTVHGRAGGDDQGRLLVAHLIRDMDQGVDVVDGVLGEAAVGGEAVGPVTLVVTLVVQAVVEAGGVHPLPAPLAAAAPGMDLHGDAVADFVLVDARPELDDGAHVLVARGEILVEGGAALDDGGQSLGDDLHVGPADRNRVDPHQDLGGPGSGTGFSVSRSCSGPSRTQAFMVLGTASVLVCGCSGHGFPPYFLIWLQMKAIFAVSSVRSER